MDVQFPPTSLLFPYGFIKWVGQHNRLRRRWIIAHRRRRGSLYGTTISHALFAQSTYHSYSRILTDGVRNKPHIIKWSRFIRKVILTSKRLVAANAPSQPPKNKTKRRRRKVGSSSKRTRKKGQRSSSNVPGSSAMVVGLIN